MQATGAVPLTMTSLDGQLPSDLHERYEKTYAKMRIRTIETKTFDSYRYARTH